MNGLSYQEVLYRKENGLSNNVEVVNTRSIKQIIKSNTITLFNVLNITLFILVLTTGYIQNATFVTTIVFNTFISIYQEIKAKRVLDSIKINKKDEVTVIRDGKREVISKEEIVMDDVVLLSSGDSIVTDMVVLKSSSLEVDESIITGEADAIIKKKDDKIMSGCFVTSGSGYARVISIGKNDYASNLVKEASEIKDNSSFLQRTINNIFKVITILIVPVGIMLFVSQYFFSHQSYSEAVLGAVAGIIGMIPEGLVLLTSIALTAGVVKMASKKVIIQRLHGIEILSCTDVLCLDKTGTITDGTMEVVDVITLDKRINIYDIISNILTEEANNATDIALKKKFGVKSDLNVMDRTPFSSLLKCSITNIDNVNYYLGALEYITDKKVTDYMVLDDYLKNGNRILTLVRGENKEVIAFIILKDNVRKSAKDTLKYFKEEGVDIKVISGDNPITVSNILKGLDFEGYDLYIEGKDLPSDDNKLIEVANKMKIFGRMKPQDKQRVIRALKKNNTVSMIGDGVNDILGLKEADCGISLGSGVSAARGVSEVILSDDDFSSLPDIVNEGRRVVNNIERVSSMYLIKTAYSFFLSLMVIFMGYEYPFYPVQLSLISAFCVGIPSFFLAFEPNYNKSEKNFLVKVFRNALSNGIVVVLNIFVIIMICTIFNKNFETYRIVVVSLTGFITLRLLYMICKPLSMLRKILLIFCSLSFVILLVLYPDLFLVSKFSIISIVLILLFAYIDTYVIDFFENIYDKIGVRIRGVYNERSKKKERNKLS